MKNQWNVTTFFFMAMWASSIWKDKITFSTGKKKTWIQKTKTNIFYL